MKIRKAVIPVAGLGTRFLPATKTVPKELLPIIDIPSIQYVVQEAVDAGIQEIIFVTGRGKDGIEDHFDEAPELEQILADRGQTATVDMLRRISEMTEVVSVRQKKPLGLGHAVLCARDLVGDVVTMRALLLAVILAGCYQPSFAPCHVRCSDGTSCPSGFTCGTDGRCKPEGTTDSCDAILDALSKRPEVEIAEPDALYSLDPNEKYEAPAVMQWAGFPIDPQYKFQWHMRHLNRPAEWKVDYGNGRVVA
jgi:hypothetical protein